MVSVGSSILNSSVQIHSLTVFTYRQMMELVLKYNRRMRPIVSLPFAIGVVQGTILERLPLNLFTVTRAQV